MLNRITLQMAVALAVCTVAPSLLAQTTNADAAAPDIGGPSAIWRDATKSPDQRARDILPRLTLQEKISLLHADGTFTTPGLPRFGSRKLWMSDGPNGVREELQATGWNPANRTNDFATAMPSNVGLAASFDPALGNAYGRVIGEEARTRGKNIMLGPGLNIMRTPLNGRNSEYLGEDPFLASRMAVGLVDGIQSFGVAACAKHYALNNQEIRRGSVNVRVDERTMREIYLPAFKAAVTEGHAWAVMAAYNRVNGQYCSENDFLLNQVLKQDWGFQGLVMTDWGGCHSTADAANRGLDLEMGSNVGGSPTAHDRDFLANRLMQAVTAENPLVPMSRLDNMVLRNLRVMFATGVFDPIPANAAVVPLMSPEHIATARKIAENAIVLLKNKDNLLPLNSSSIKSIAVIGENARAKFAHDGDSAGIKTAYEVTPLDGISNRAGGKIVVKFAPGFARPIGRGRGPFGAPGAAPVASASLLDEAISIAKDADVAIIIAGLFRNQDQEGNDRSTFELPPGQAELISAVAKANPHTVVVLNGGSPSAVSSWLDGCGALLMYWYGGTEGGNALANVLFGDANPSAHLPCTWPKQLADSPAHSTGNVAEYPGAGDVNYTEGILVGYRWFDARNIEPQFPFGFGLSYTTFELSGLEIGRMGEVGVAHLNTPLAKVAVSVANTGSRDGAQVVQVYIEPAKSSLPRSPRELKGFAKVIVTKGQRGTVSIPLDVSSFAFFDPEKQAWIAEAGDYVILAGDSSRHLPLKSTFNLAQTITVKEGQ
jgi:beta-glucosidase